MQTLLYNATLVLPQRVIAHGWLVIENAYIYDLGEAETTPKPHDFPNAIDGAGHYLLPGVIDLHCDSIERFVEPRPKVMMDMHIALSEADWRLAGSGITTEFHAVSLDDGEFGIRSYTFVRDLSHAIQARHDVAVRHRIHARVELTSHDGTELACQMIEKGEVGLVSLMDHSPGQGQYRTEEAFRYYVMRTGDKSEAEVDALLVMKREQARAIPQRIARLTHLARAMGIALATHDDDTAEKVAQWPALGVSVIEFPTTLEAAQCAHQLGLAVCMGAPNVLRGRSSGGNLSATTVVQEGIANVLCSDYYPGAMLSAVFKLATQQLLPLPHAVRLVTLNPAQAAGLDHEFGSLEKGKIADIILVDVNEYGTPRVQRMFVGGREVISFRY